MNKVTFNGVELDGFNFEITNAEYRASHNGDTLTPSPTPAPKRVFVTSTTYKGNLGGLAGADAKCQTRANAASLGGTWKAWLSDSTTSAASRLTQSVSGYILLNNLEQALFPIYLN